MTDPEFSRTVRLDTLGQSPRRLAIEAGREEREALARRFGLPAIAALSAEAELIRAGEEVRATGRIRGQVTQSCVATGEPLPASVDESFALVFRPRPPTPEPDEEIELDESELDLIFYDGAAIDLGEAVAQTLPLALEPYPRRADAAEALDAAGVKSEDRAKAESNPFAVLKDKFRE